MFAPAIKEMTAEVTAMYDEFSKKIVIKYSYSHSGGGSNGYTVILTNHTNSKFEWVYRSF